MPPRLEVPSPRRAILLLLAGAGVLATSGRATELAWPRPAGARELVTDAARFQPFAARVAADVERALGAVPAPAGETLARLLSLRVHLGLYLGHDACALVAATQIREASAPGERAFSGLLTEALVVARGQAPDGTGAPGFTDALRAALDSRLATLPATAGLDATLGRQRRRFHELTRDTLLAEVAQLDRRLDGASHWTLADVDEVVRVGHRLATILPLREVLLAAFDAAIARRGAGAGEARRSAAPGGSSVAR